MELRHLNQFSRILFGDDQLGSSKVIETFVLMQMTHKNLKGSQIDSDETSQEILYEPILKQLVYQAERVGTHAKLNLNDPFFRLSPKERLILTALEAGQFSYQQIAQWLAISVMELEKIAFRARTSLVPKYQAILRKKGPTAACPSSIEEVPWVQRFFDEEYGRKEQLLIQSHVVKCEGCQKTMRAAREFFFELSRLIPDGSENSKREGIQTNAPLHSTIQNTTHVENLMIPKGLIRQHSLSAIFMRAIIGWSKRGWLFLLIYAVSAGALWLIISPRS